MKKRLLTAISAVCLTMLGMAQTSLPTSWNFATQTLPTGWSETNVNSTTLQYYSASGNPAPAYKLDATGDKLTIFFASTPGNLTYDLTGNSFSGGTFLVEESADGTTWTTLHTFTAPPAGTYTSFTDVPNSASRYIRFNYQLKSAGNIGIDNVSIAQGVSATQQISVQQGSTTIVNGGTFATSSPVSVNTPVTFTVQNLGAATLNVSGVTITGPDAADYSVSSFPATVAASGNGSMVIDFTPSASGSRFATINIANDDPTGGNPYIINMYGIGGTLASEPMTQASNMTFTNVKSYHLNAAFTLASPAVDGYIVLRRTGSPVTDMPVDGTVYTRGDVIGNSKVVYSSNATGFFPNEIVANTTYYFAVYSYNGPGTYRNYFISSPLIGTVTTPGSMQPASYYSSALTSNPTFVTNLQAKINPHTIQFYSNYGPLMVNKFYARDTTAGQRVVTCVYSGENKIYSEPFDWTATGFSREHTYCNSWMPTTNNTPDNTSLPEYNDYHMLTPTNQVQVNGMRSNYPLGVVVGTPTYTYLGCKIGNDAYGHKVFEPRDADKGDAARAMMYECICYTGVAYSGPANTNVTYGGSWSLPSRISNSIPYGQDQNILKTWHYMDPPDNFEISRNDYVDSLQGNRNPFIDSVQFACYIDFSTMTKMPNAIVPCNNMTTGIESNDNNNELILLAPNPNSGDFTLTYVSSKNQSVNVTLFDMVGRIVYSANTKVVNGYNPIEMNLQNLSKGVYTFVLVTETGRKTEKLVIE